MATTTTLDLRHQRLNKTPDNYNLLLSGSNVPQTEAKRPFIMQPMIFFA